MKKIIYSISTLVVLIIMVSCQKQLITYEGKPDIYFNDAGKQIGNSTETNTDSISISFSLAKGTDSTQKVVIASTGALFPTDRAYTLQIDPASTAVVGKHYDALPTEFLIRKNKVRDTILLKIHRTADMQTSSFVLYLNLVANENFATEMREKVTNATTGKKMSFIRYKINLNDILKKPARWLDGYFGVFTRKKLFLMCDYLNITPTYIDTSISVAELTAYSKLMQRYFNEQKVAGKTIYEDDGTEMIMGPNAQ